MLKNWKSFLLRHELLILILCLTAILRLPSLLEPYWYGDEGIYLTLGVGIRHGLTLYKQVHDNKPPGIYFLAAIAGSLFWFRLMLLVWNLASIAVFAWISGKLLKFKPSKPFLIGGIEFPRPNRVTLATLLFAVIPFFAEGNIANGEIFMLLPVLVGFALLIRTREINNKRQKILLTAASGISFSLAFLIKVPAIFDAVAAGIFFYLISAKPLNSVKERFISSVRGIFSIYPWIFGLAFFLPILASIGYYYAIGAGEPYLKAALLQNVGYLSSWATGTHQANLAQTGLANRGIALGLFSLVLILIPLTLSSEVILLLLWLGFALFGALLSERPYPHYLIQVIPPLSLMLVLILDKFQKIAKRDKITSYLGDSIFLVGAIVVLVVSVITLKFWSYPLLPYYQNYINFMTKRIDKNEYLSYFDKSLPEQYELARYISEHTSSTDPIFIWSDLPSLYALTRRLPPGRFTATYHVKDFKAHDETYAAILKTPPKYILIDKRVDQFNQLTGLLAEEYAVVYRSEIFSLYRRSNF